MDFAYKHSRVKQYLEGEGTPAHRDRHQQTVGYLTVRSRPSTCPS